MDPPILPRYIYSDCCSTISQDSPSSRQPIQAIDYYHRALTLDRNDVFSAEMLNFAITEAQCQVKLRDAQTVVDLPESPGSFFEA